MARLIVRREPRGHEEGVPAGAIVGSLSVHTVVLLFMVWGASRLAIPEPPQATLPTLVPTWAMKACSAITDRSQANWLSLPPPTAIPFKRAITGLPVLRILSM